MRLDDINYELGLLKEIKVYFFEIVVNKIN